jgi:hypothetical protein
MSALVLRLKGYRIIGLRSIDLPSNWISIHPGLKDVTVIAIMYQRCRQITHRFTMKTSPAQQHLADALTDLKKLQDNGKRVIKSTELKRIQLSSLVKMAS